MDPFSSFIERWALNAEEMHVKLFQRLAQSMIVTLLINHHSYNSLFFPQGFESENIKNQYFIKNSWQLNIL